MLVIAIAAIVAVCNQAADPPTTTVLTTTTIGVTTTAVSPTSTVGPTTTAVAPTTIAVAPTTSPPIEQTATVLLSPFSAMGPEWNEQVFPYGEGEESLGTAPGGDGLMLGPEYGTQTPDASWWFLDAAKLRVAHFAAEGSYLDQVIMPEDVLVDGLNFQYQMPQGLDDGSIAAGGFRSEDTMSLLRIAGGQATGTTVDGAIPWVTTDGRVLFGFDIDAEPRSLDPDQPQPEPVQWFQARNGSRYMVTLNEDGLLVELPDAGLTRTLLLRYPEVPEVVAHGGIEVETGVDGTIFIMIYGAPESDETLGIGGFVSVGPDGTVSEAEPIADPFSASDPGSPSHLGVTPGTSTPWIMVVGEDGVHVFTRAG